MIDENGNYVVDVPALTAREGGHTVTATVKPNGWVSYEVDEGDFSKRDIGNDECWDGYVCAHLVTQLRLVQRARRACEALMNAHTRMSIAYTNEVLGDSTDSAGAVVALRQAQAEYNDAIATLPHTLL